MPVKRTGGLSGKLKRLTSDMERDVGKAVYTVAGLIETDAANSLEAGAVSGKNHVPSAPGTPPNSDNRFLQKSIHVENLGPLRARVVADMPYAAIQELGGTVQNPGGQPYFIKDGEFIPVSKSSPAAARLPKTKPHTITLPERPYMRPAAAKNRESGKKLMTAAVDRVLKGGTIT